MRTAAILPLYKQEGDKYVFKGSGFFLTEELLATAWHVIRNGGRFALIGEHYIELEVLFKATPEQNGADFAVCSLSTAAHFHSLKLESTVPPKGIICQVKGFLRNRESGAVESQIFECIMEQEHPYGRENMLRFQGHAGKTNQGKMQGMSGGPIINSEGKVVGLLSSGGRPDMPVTGFPDVEIYAVPAYALERYLSNYPNDDHPAASL